MDKRVFKVFVFIVVLAMLQIVDARPSRIKRVSSDARLAELETIIGLRNLAGKLVTVPLGMGKVDPQYIGRKRRSQPRFLDVLFNQSVEDDDGDPVEKEDDYYNR
ncbi:uncharacterized protein LOC108739668 [Agrilus planipennis]|uniref:Uncharacterized protein LOC108739668 n=1 Tax=Agrilus planipennis TaxID=224129 RepID=A0A1W4WZ64_AGRPL|nr:uncharacterized protein LOC108739668 [Agrilus planipennis]